MHCAAGEDTSVLFGFLNTLLNLLELSPPPTHFAVVCDARGKTFRQAKPSQPALRHGALLSP